MRIEFTVRGPAGSRDVAVCAAVTTPVAEVLPALARLAGVGSVEPAWLGARRMAGTVGDCGLRPGAIVSFGEPAPSTRPVGLHAVHVVGGTRAGDPVPLRGEGVTAGRDPGCHVVLRDDRASRRHVTLRAGPSGVTVHDLGSTNGTTLDGVPVPPAGATVEAGAVIRVGDSLLAVAAADPPPRAALMRGSEGALQVNRAPRRHAGSPALVIDRGDPAGSAPPGRVQWIAALLPAVAGGLLAWLLSAPMFLLFALLSPAMLLGTAAGDRLHWRRERRRADVLARRRRAAVDEQISAALRAETAARRTASPNPSSLVDIATLPGRRLWEREPGDPDHLGVRIGSADVESATTVRYDGRSAAAGVVPSVPAVVDLRSGALGVAGTGAVVDDVARWIVTQLAVLHAPAELDIVVVGGERADRWTWCRWLPHLRADPTGHDAVATTLATLTALRDRRRDAAAASGLSAGGWTGRWSVVVADRLAGSDAAALGALLAGGPAHGITAICLADTMAALPAACRSVALADTASDCRVRLRSPAGDDITVLADRVAAPWAEQVARSLAPLTDARSGVSLPAECRWGDLVRVDDPDAVADGWLGTDGGARTLLGLGRDGPVAFDLVADGPHALVAGTTGSGKSELLRTLVVGLAANYPPDELSFLLVDYKGGAAFAEAVRLPHTTGVLTDLDAGLTGRALQSLEAELRRREGLLAVAGVDDLAGYRRWLRGHDGTPLARLVIVVDEFAELATDLPDFVPGLIGVARRGRSLGVHLVLATQRPGSVVSAEIRANTALRISLRVTEAVESTDVIGVPDAALLDPGLPGRAYARIGQRVVELQTARVAADEAVSHPVVEPLGAWCRPEARGPASTDTSDAELRRVVDLIAEAGRCAGSARPHAPWLPPLPPSLALADLEDPDPSEVPLGRLDRPADQSQPVFGLDRAGDAVLVIGQARSGRTTTLLTAAVSATVRTAPDALQLHVVDGSGALAAAVTGLPHLGTVVTRAGVELVPRLLDRLASRPRAMSSLLLVDDWDLVTSGLDDAFAAQWTEQLAAVVRTAGPDLTVLVAGGRQLLSPRFAGGFASRLLLPLADPTDYGLAGLPRSAVPESPTPGGGVRAPDSVAFRVAHAGTEPTVEAARAAVDGIARRWRSHPAATGVRLRALPSRVRLDTVRLPSGTAGVALGLAGDTAAPCVVDLVGRRSRFLVAGPARSGRSTALMTAATGAVRSGHALVVVAPPRSPLREHVRTLGVETLDRIPAAPPRRPALLVVDDIDACDESLADTLAGWLRDPTLPVGAIAAGRTDELVTSYRALAAEVRRDRCGVLLRPGPLDGELLGVRLRPAVGGSPPGRGVVVGDPRWGPPFTEADAVPIQLAYP